MNLVKLLFTFRLHRDAADRFALFSMRAPFMDIFRALACKRGGDCLACTVGAACSYHATFNQALSTDPSAVKRHQKPSLPFVFDLPVLPPQPNSGALLEIGLTLFGSAITHADAYIEAVERLFASPPAQGIPKAALEKIEFMDYQGERTLLPLDLPAARTGVAVLSARGLMETAVINPRSIRFSITTPLRLFSDGKPLKTLDPYTFLMAVARRVSSLSYYFGEGEMESEYGGVAQAARSVNLSGAFSWVDLKGGEREGRLSGVMGEGTMTGDMADFLPFLILGRHAHVGKGAPFGLGNYALR